MLFQLVLGGPGEALDTLDSRIRLPSIRVPINGNANGTSTPTMIVTRIGK